MQPLDQDKLLNLSNNEKASSPSKKQTAIKIHHKCSGGNALSQFCVNKKCEQKNKFVCQDDECQCNQNHESCANKGKIKTVLKKLNQKSEKNQNGFIDKLKQQISQIFTDLIDQISQNEQKLIKDLQNNIKYAQFTDVEMHFYQAFTKNKDYELEQFDKQKLTNLLEIIQSNFKQQNYNQELLKKYTKNIKKVEQLCFQTIQQTRVSIQLVVNRIKQQMKPNQLKYEQIQIQNAFKKLYPNPLLPSSQLSTIINTQTQLNNLIKFFDKKIKKINLMFKASENDFQMGKYYQKCGNLKNTIILCLTQKNKILGGFTPLSFQPNFYKNTYVNGQTQQSFLFSLSNNHKFQLHQKQYAINRDSSKQYIAFGNGYTFVISNYANNNQNSCFYLNYNTYKNQNYVGNKQSYLKLNGNSSKFFKVKQWEVLQVEFQ